MKKYLYTLLLLSVCFHAFPQQYGNEWISYGQPYYRITVIQDGLYRIDSTTLANAGIDMNTDIRTFQIYGRGQMDSLIYIKDANNNHKINSGDYIEFYAKHNDGWYDSKLYNNTSLLPNPNYSQFNDTATYYLTISQSINNYRVINGNDTNYSSFSLAPFINKVSRVDYTSNFFYGLTDNNEVTDFEYVLSKGWFDNGFSLGGIITKSVPTANIYSSGNATIDLLFIGESNYTGVHPNHHINLKYANVIKDTTTDSYYTWHYHHVIPCSASGFGPTSTTFTIASINNLGSNADNNTIAYINIKYPHTLNLEADSSFLMYVQPSITGQAYTYLNLNNFAVAPGDSVRLYDFTDHERIKVAQSGANYKVLVPSNSGVEKKCFITSESKIHHVSSLIPVSYSTSNYAKFRDYTTSTVLKSNYIIISHNSLWNEAKSYAGYRASSNGGGFDTLLVDINDLYDQFCYGIRKDPLAVKNFAYFAYKNFDSIPKDIFILGKGYQADDYRNNYSYYSEALIPGLGVPASDVLFTKFDTTLKQYIPTGRLAARNPTQIDWYLNKVQDYETAQQEANGINPVASEWMKNVLHFGGGDDISQQYILESYLNGYAQTIEGPYFGGYVRTFLKNSTLPIEINLSDSLHTIINNGVSIMTFFGHGAGIGFDESIDYPSDYNNYKRYPFLLANSCLSGDLFSLVPTSSEAWVIIQDKGSIAYLGAAATGIQQYLNVYSGNFYKNIGIYNYGRSVGKCVQNTIDTVMHSPSYYFYDKTTCLGMSLHGDPAIKINYFNKPDYVLTPLSLYFNPSDVTTSDSVFTLNVISTNQGRAIIGTFVVNVQRQYPDGTYADSARQIPATLFRDTIRFKFPVNLSKGVGLNTFTVTLDYYNQISEISETNNTATTTLLITADDITPIYPYEYAIVPSLNVTLKASTGNPFAPLKNYIFEIDTTDAFNSPIKVTRIVSHTGGVVTWTPILPVTKNNIVYYWHVASTDNKINGNYRWRESSFQYVKGKRGWAQAHFFQFKNDVYNYVHYNKPRRKFDFVNNIVQIYAQTGNFKNNGFYNWTEEYYNINGSLENYWNCVGNLGTGQSAVKVAVFDSISAAPWFSQVPSTVPGYGIYGEYHCNPVPVEAFDFFFDTPQHRDTVAYFINHIPTNDYVLVMTHESPNYSQWDTKTLNAFASIGSTIGTVMPADTLPYMIIGQKGVNLSTSASYQRFFPNEYLDTLTRSITTKWNKGYIESTLIGPAKSWDSLHWRVRSIDPRLTDSVTLIVYGIKSNGTIVPLIQNLHPVPGSMDISLWNKIDSNQYHYLQLEAIMRDDTFHTPSQMVKWQVMYREVPETALDPSANYYFHADTLQEGDNVRFSTATHNVSEFNMDSLLIHYWIQDKNRVIHPVYYHRFRKHPAGDILFDTVTYSTKGLAGLNSMWIEVNPNNDQLEQYHFNNIAEKYFYVNSDKINPLLDVTFDGVHILNGDIVSAKPTIQISLKDENKFLIMNNQSDTSLFQVFIQNPGVSTANRVYFMSGGKEIMKFFPIATSTDNKCRVEWDAAFPVDGTYKLLVQAKDISGNNSGSNSYQIDFEVINKSMITDVMNYPNPFSTSTRFVFTLTGSVIPTYFKIEITTITGKIVREIELSDLGSIHIGRNITQYAWDGKDNFGDQLANGVYLYRVLTSINGNSIDKMQSGADQYITKGFGKMYLMK